MTFVTSNINHDEGNNRDYDKDNSDDSDGVKDGENRTMIPIRRCGQRGRRQRQRQGPCQAKER